MKKQNKPTKNTTKSSSKKKFFSKPWARKILKILKIIIIVFFASSIFFTLLYRFVNPPITPLMLIRAIEMKWDGKPMKIEKQWVALEDISKNMVFAVVASEDQKFYQHSGFDFEAIEKAMEHNEKSKRIKGGSTISQQTAKNVFLWPSRSWLRKGLEAWFTVLIEFFWTKERIMEVYLNVIEFGEGIYGVEAASQHYYKKSSSQLNRQEAASLAVILPNPRKWNPVKQNYLVRKRAQWTLRQMNYFEGLHRRGKLTHKDE